MKTITGTKGEYSVCQFFKDGHWEYTRRFVSAEEAFSVFRHYCTSVAANMGLVERVIITDGGDCTNAEWVHGKGMVFPTLDDVNAAIDKVEKPKNAP